MLGAQEVKDNSIIGIPYFCIQLVWKDVTKINGAIRRAEEHPTSLLLRVASIYRTVSTNAYIGDNACTSH